MVSLVPHLVIVVGTPREYGSWVRDEGRRDLNWS